MDECVNCYRTFLGWFRGVAKAVVFAQVMLLIQVITIMAFLTKADKVLLTVLAVTDFGVILSTTTVLLYCVKAEQEARRRGITL